MTQDQDSVPEEQHTPVPPPSPPGTDAAESAFQPPAQPTQATDDGDGGSRAQPPDPPRPAAQGTRVRHSPVPWLGAGMVGAVIGSVVTLVAVLALLPIYLPDRVQQDPSGLLPPDRQVLIEGWPIPAVVEEVGPAVVLVINHVRQGATFVQRGSGSGFIFDQGGFIITNYHVIERADRVTVVLPGAGDEEHFEAEVVGTDPPTDLAVLRVNAGRALPTAALGDSADVVVGELLAAIGNPLGLAFQRSVTVGVLSGVRDIPYGAGGTQERIFEVIQTDAAINPGNSGGPLVNAAGEVIGVTSFKIAIPEVESMGFAIPANDVRRIVNELVEHGQVRRAALGIHFLPASAEEIRLRFDPDFERGVYVTDIQAGGAAAQAGMQAGDTIVAMDDVTVDDHVDLLRQMEQRRPGEDVTIHFIRDGSAGSVTLTLGELPADPPQ